MFKQANKNFLKEAILNSFFLLSAIVLAQHFLCIPAEVSAKPKGFWRPPVAKVSVYEAEKLLAEQGYWITKVDGVKDASTYHALMAFQKVAGRKRTGVLTENELAALRASRRPEAAFSGGAVHLEIDLRRQVIFLVDENGTVARILPVSTGNEQRYFDEGKWQIAHTPRGVFRITRQIKGVRQAPLGTLYHPNYFSGGVAIHGSLLVPPYPASHGCVRIPYFAAAEFSSLVWVGMPVFVFENPGDIKL